MQFTETPTTETMIGLAILCIVAFIVLGVLLWALSAEVSNTLLGPESEPYEFGLSAPEDELVSDYPDCDCPQCLEVTAVRNG